jgi:DNA-3-methyladenine glycosylase
LLGTILVARDGRSLLAARIVETEAYLGLNDPAAHAAAGRTPRNFVLFGPPGRAYVYFIYGNHWCLNISCLPEGRAGCVLIRALEPLAGLERMARNRGLDLAALRSPARLRILTSGPGRLCEAFAITRPRDNDSDVTNRDSRLFIAASGQPRPRIVATGRVGITKAAAQRLRYLIRDNPFVSGPRSYV